MKTDEIIASYKSAKSEGDYVTALKHADTIVQDYVILLKTALKMEDAIHNLVKKLEQYETW